MEIIKDDDEIIINDNNQTYIEEETSKSKLKVINTLLVVIDFSLAIYLIYNIIAMFTK